MEPGSMPVILVAVLLLLSAFFSMAETSLVSLSKLRLRHLLEENVKGAKTLEKLINEGRYLTAILIGNNFVNILISSVATSLVNKAFGGSGLALLVTTVMVTLVILVFGEVTPKSLAARYTEKAALFVAGPISFVTTALLPLSAFLNALTGLIIRRVEKGGETAPAITESELKTMVNVGREEGVIDTDEQALIHNVFDFGNANAETVMTPRTDIAAVSTDASYGETMQIFREEQFSRLPVYKNDIDHIVGILHFKDFIFADTDAEHFRPADYMREPFFSYESKETLSLLTEMRSLNINLAVILDEYGGTAGIVSLEDLIEELVGEIYDEYDKAEAESEGIKDIGDKEYRADGGAKLDEFNQHAGTKLESEDYETLGGYVMGLLGRIPEKGAVARGKGITFCVEEVSKNRIEKLKITLT